MLLEGKPLKGRELKNLKLFLKKMELEYDEEIEYSVCILNEDYEIIGTGSVDGNVIKCVAIDPEYQGQGLSATVISQLVQYEFEKGCSHIFIYTKPKNLRMFADMGFYTIMETENVLFMENRREGFSRFLREIRSETLPEAMEKSCIAGAVVANCNPFTLGHRYLLEQALKQCDYLHLFVLSDDRSAFSAKERFEMVKKGILGLDRVILHKTSDYMISAATFPTYFFKDQAQGKAANCKLDLEIFASRIAPHLHLSRRFVGTEPFCRITDAYNMEMKKILPAYGIEVIEIPRLEKEGMPVSASKVRSCLEKRDYDRVKELVPGEVFAYLAKEETMAVQEIS